MSSSNLDNLVKSGLLKEEPANRLEIAGLLHSAQVRLKDAENITLSQESRFDLAYNAAHALALSALRLRGYRSTNRYLVFQSLPHTTGLGPEVWRILSKCHQKRNLAEYEGEIEIEEQLLNDLLKATKKLSTTVIELTSC
jgi:hypothetical protein